ncbi:unnamed protein product [marine sediment metagenome]|uniref:Uncharacterized protein n=1 Tax=marine sediment metagenome TaxID=412755 RepID=X1V1K9_9ZZZZ
MTNYIAWSKDESNVLKSSSGGIFLELAKEMINRGGYVIGVVMPDFTPYYTIASHLLLAIHHEL